MWNSMKWQSTSNTPTPTRTFRLRPWACLEVLRVLQMFFVFEGLCVEVLWGFLTWIRWIFNWSKFLKFPKALELDSNRILNLERMIWMHHLRLFLEYSSVYYMSSNVFFEVEDFDVEFLWSFDAWIQLSFYIWRFESSSKALAWVWQSFDAWIIDLEWDLGCFYL